MADKKPLVNDAGNAVEIATGDTIPIANGGTNATTKGGAISNLFNESVTIANCSNTSSEVTVLSATVPANTWGDGEQFMLFGAFLHKQNSGVSRNFTMKIKVGGTSYTALSASSVTNSANEGKSTRNFIFTRVGTEVWGAFGTNGVGFMGSTSVPALSAISVNQFTGSGNIWTGLNFAATIAIEITIQWSAADANVYFNPQVGRAVKL